MGKSTDVGSSKKEKNKLNKFDARGVQTLFRTLSRNHYTLLRMVDNKASIMLTVNSIIISLLMGVIYVAPEDQSGTIQLGSKILLNCGMASMVFALIAMLPHKYIRMGKKNRGILYAQNFSKLSLQEYNEEMQKVISTGNATYKEMINDLYFLGKSISIKQMLILIAGGIFLLGLVATILLTLSKGIMIEKILFDQ